MKGGQSHHGTQLEQEAEPINRCPVNDAEKIRQAQDEVPSWTINNEAASFQLKWQINKQGSKNLSTYKINSWNSNSSINDY